MYTNTSRTERTSNLYSNNGRESSKKVLRRPENYNREAKRIEPREPKRKKNLLYLLYWVLYVQFYSYF